jgi:hypothetical protein
MSPRFRQPLIACMRSGNPVFVTNAKAILNSAALVNSSVLGDRFHRYPFVEHLRTRKPTCESAKRLPRFWTIYSLNPDDDFGVGGVRPNFDRVVVCRRRHARVERLPRPQRKNTGGTEDERGHVTDRMTAGRVAPATSGVTWFTSCQSPAKGSILATEWRSMLPRQACSRCCTAPHWHSAVTASSDAPRTPLRPWSSNHSRTF